MVVDPLVSVLMTAYNRDRFIAEAIESVLKQTYSNFELIIVDDCSTDKTPDIARSFQLKDSRIRFYINDKNLGDYHNRNKAASFAKGVYLKYLDADDVLYPNGLSEMVKAIELYPAAAFGLQCPSTLLHFQLPQILYPKDSLNKHYFNGGVFISGPSGSIIRKDIFDKVGGLSGKRFLGD
jgi:glycosyltransferase involved in cell wall biosynthesis